MPQIQPKNWFIGDSFLYCSKFCIVFIRVIHLENAKKLANLSLILKNRIHPSTSPYCVQWKTDRNILSTHVCILHRASDLWGFWLIVPQFCFLEVLRMSKWWCSIYLSTLKKVPFYDNLESRSTTKAAVLSTHLNVKLDNVTLDYLFN